MKYKSFFLTILFLCIASILSFKYFNLNNTIAANDNQPNIVNFEINEAVAITGLVTNLIVKVVLPKTRINRQEVLNLKFSPYPTRFIDQYDNTYAVYEFENITQSFNISIKGKIKLFPYNLKTAITNVNKDFSDSTNLNQYLKPQTFIESNDSRIRSVANKINASNELDTIQQIFNYVLEKMSYQGYNPNDVGAAAAISQGLGDCSEYTDLMVALCRAKGIPARPVYGFTSVYSNTPKHSWVEVYTKNNGWLSFDPTMADFGSNTFDYMPPIYIYLSHLKSDPTLNNYYYMTYNYWGAPLNVIDTFTASTSRW